MTNKFVEHLQTLEGLYTEYPDFPLPSRWEIYDGYVEYQIDTLEDLVKIAEVLGHGSLRRAGSLQIATSDYVAYETDYKGITILILCGKDLQDV